MNAATSTGKAASESDYFAVIFSSQQNDDAPASQQADYARTAQRMVALASQQPGFLGVDSARNPDGFGITVSYWRSLEDIAEWRRHAEHRLARERGRETWYKRYRLRIMRIEREYAWSRD